MDRFYAVFYFTLVLLLDYHFNLRDDIPGGSTAPRIDGVTPQTPCGAGPSEAGPATFLKKVEHASACLVLRSELADSEEERNDWSGLHSFRPAAKAANHLHTVRYS